MKKDYILKDFGKVDYSEIKMPIIVIYNKPKDYPDQYIARLWDGEKPTNCIALSDTLADLRDKIPCSFVMLNAFANDDPTIVETWL